MNRPAQQQQRENVPSQPPRDGGKQPQQQQQQPQPQIDPAPHRHPDHPAGKPVA